jgi:hypothetical protein
MKKVLLGIALCLAMASAYAACVTNTTFIDGRTVVCTTCCYGNNCTTTCF